MCVIMHDIWLNFLSKLTSWLYCVSFWMALNTVLHKPKILNWGVWGKLQKWWPTKASFYWIVKQGIEPSISSRLLHNSIISQNEKNTIGKVWVRSSHCVVVKPIKLSTYIMSVQGSILKNKVTQTNFGFIKMLICTETKYCIEICSSI